MISARSLKESSMINHMLTKKSTISSVNINRAFVLFTQPSRLSILKATGTWAYSIDRGKINAAVFLDPKGRHTRGD